MVISLERGADFHMAQLMPLLLTVSCCSKIQIGFTFLIPAQLGSPGKRAVKRVCVCVCTFRASRWRLGRQGGPSPPGEAHFAGRRVLQLRHWFYFTIGALHVDIITIIIIINTFV